MESLQVGLSSCAKDTQKVLSIERNDSAYQVRSVRVLLIAMP